MADKITAEIRESFGKGSSRQLRRDGRTPAVVYGHGIDPTHISFDSHEIFLATKGKANPLLNVTVDGKEIFALVKEIQRHPIRRTINHLDLLVVTEKEKVDVEVPVVVEGESFSGTLSTLEVAHLTVQAPVISIPESIVVNIDGRQGGEHLTIADIEFPKNVVCDMDPETIVVGIATTKRSGGAEEEVDNAESEEEAAAE